MTQRTPQGAALSDLHGIENVGEQPPHACREDGGGHDPTLCPGDPGHAIDGPGCRGGF